MLSPSIEEQQELPICPMSSCGQNSKREGNGRVHWVFPILEGQAMAGLWLPGSVLPWEGCDASRNS